MNWQCFCPTEADLIAVAGDVAACIREGMQFNLVGDLGAGKTTLVRGIIQALGHAGAVKSPTYGLVEAYSLEGLTAQHFDLYRMEDPEELEFIGWRDLLGDDVVSFFEWPERGDGVLSSPDVSCHLAFQGGGRSVRVQPMSPVGDRWFACFSERITSKNN